MEQIILLDGGTGHLLLKHIKQISPSFDHPLWSSGIIKSHPELVRTVHEEFIAAGAQILFSNTYSLHFKINNVDEVNIIYDLMLKNVILLEELAIKWNIKYCISIGPIAVRFHDCSEYSASYLDDGRVIEDDIYEHYDVLLQQVQKLKKDFVVFETIPSFVEVKIVLKVLQNYPTIKCFLTVVSINTEQTAHGDFIVDIAKVVSGNDQVLAFGINCSDPRLCLPIARILSPIVTQKLIMKPNDGRIYSQKQKKYVGDKYDLRQDLIELSKNKVCFIGGCCTVEPDIIISYQLFLQNGNFS